MAHVFAAFDEFAAAAADGLLRTAYLITADKGEAEDLVQECFFTVAKHWPRVRGMHQPTAYARRVLVNLAVRESKQQRRRQAELNNDPIDIAADWVELDLIGSREELRNALGQLTSRQRAVLVLRYFHDLSEEQTAHTLGCTVGTVKSTASRSLAQLRLLITPSTSERGANQND
jgi:RNA polymerase sigma-70 factor (sigma-E family)